MAGEGMPSKVDLRENPPLATSTPNLRHRRLPDQSKHIDFFDIICSKRHDYYKYSKSEKEGNKISLNIENTIKQIISKLKPSDIF